MPFIFPRSFIQSCLDDVRRSLDREQYEAILSRLNGEGGIAFEAMWELLFLCAVHHQKDFVHEQPLSDGRKPDFQFRLPVGRWVVGDVGVVSDYGRIKSNPIDKLQAELSRLAKKNGLTISNFNLRVFKESGGEFILEKVQIGVPRGSAFSNFSKCRLKPFVQERAGKRDYGYCELLRGEDYNIQLEFVRSGGGSIGYPSFRHIYEVEKNVIWEALRRKSTQLRASPDDAVRVVILCDGGCRAMEGDTSGLELDASQIVDSFLRKHQGIDIVFLATAVHGIFLGSPRHSWKIRVRERWMQNAENCRDAESILKILDSFLRLLPPPTNSPEKLRQIHRRSGAGTDDPRFH